jgi:signal transduction histidine kinase
MSELQPLSASALTSRVGQSRWSWIAFGAAAIAALAISLGASLWLEHRAELTTTRRMADKAALALERHTQATFDILDGVLRATADQLARAARRGDTTGLDDILRRNAEGHAAVRSISLRDANGRLMHFTGISVPPRRDASPYDYFRAQRDGTARGTFIGTPIRSRINGEWLIPISRRVDGAHGEFAGIVVATLPVNFFSDFFRSLQFGRHGVLSIFRADGITLVREPVDGLIGVRVPGSPLFSKELRPASIGEQRVTTITDGVDRIFAYRALPGLPLVVTIGIAVDDALADWYGRMHLYIGIWLLCAAMLIAFTAVMARQAAREDAALRAAADGRAEAERARTLLTDAIESISGGIVLYDADDRLVLMNRNARDWHADFAAAAVPGATYEEVIRAAARTGHIVGDGDDIETMVRHRLSLHRKAFGQPIERCVGGRWHHITEYPTSQGGVVVLRTDVTALKEANLRHEEARLLADEANRAKSDFLAMMSHELRTPLNAILGFAEVIRDHAAQLTPSKAGEYAADIHYSGMLLLTLVNDLLDLSKAEAGKMELQLAPVDVPEIVGRSLRIVNERAVHQGIELAAAADAGLPPLYADDRKLLQILLNLLSNAIKFTPAGGRVTVAAHCERNDLLTITVTDTGVGIAPEHMAKALAPFGQIDNLLTREHSGTGLGLPLAKRLTELHGGTFAIDSAVGAGTTVTLQFPLGRDLAAAA